MWLWIFPLDFLFTFPAALLQAKGQPSRPAKAITKAEFADVMKSVQEEAIAALKPRHPRTSNVELQKKLAFSFDHHAVHECPKLLEEVAGIKASQRLTLPALTPDFGNIGTPFLNTSMYQYQYR
jgi:hypothetical protein